MRTPGEDRLIEERPFSFRAAGDGHVFISWRGAVKRCLTGEAARRFLHKAATADEAQAQFLMARATGNFKRDGVEAGR